MTVSYKASRTKSGNRSYSRLSPTAFLWPSLLALLLMADTSS
jgi:hypothetical protein